MTGRILVARGVVPHRLGQPAGVLEGEVAPARQLGDGVGREEVGGRPFLGQLPGGVLDAVLADVHGQAVAVVGPGAAGAVVAAVLVVHLEDGPRAVDQLVLLPKHLRRSWRHPRRRPDGGSPPAKRPAGIWTKSNGRR